MKCSRFVLPILFAAALILAGCSKQAPPSPSPTPTPTPPPPTVTNHCTGSGTCQLTSDDLFAESGEADHECEPWHDEGAIVIAKANPKPGQFKKIKVIPGAQHPKFEVKVEACKNSISDPAPFPQAKNNGNHDGWDSADLAANAKVGSHFHLIITEKTPKGVKKGDPHIIIDPGIGNL